MLIILLTSFNKYDRKMYSVRDRQKSKQLKKFFRI